MISPSTMLMVRQWHTYIGAFVAASVLFFAFTGSLQLFSLHEAHGAYTPPAIVEMLSRVHKDQVLHAKPKPAATGGDAEAGSARKHHSAPARAAPEAPPWTCTELKP